MSIVKELLRQEGYTPTSDADAGNSGNGTGADSAGAGNAAGGEGDDSGDGAAGGAGGHEGGSGDGGGSANDEVDDEAVIAALNKRGLNIKSLAELHKPGSSEPPQETEEEKAARQAERQSKIRAFALQQGKVTSTELDRYAVDSQRPDVEIAFEAYREERLAELQGVSEDEVPSDEDLRAEFDDLHFQYAEETDPKRRLSEKRLKEIADRRLREKYAAVYGIEDEYDQHTTLAQQRTSYDSLVASTFSELPEMLEFTYQDGKSTHNVSYKPTAETLQAVRELYQNDTSFQSFGQSGVNKDVLKEAVKNNILQKDFQRILAEVHATAWSQALDSVGKGRRGIPGSEAGGVEGSQNDNLKKPGGAVQRILNEAKLKTN